MRIFTDLEFSSLTDGAELISIGACTESGESFYVEASPLPQHCSAFVQAEVIPHLEKGSSSIPVNEMEARFAAWLSRWQKVSLIVDSDWDCFILRKTFAGENSRAPGPLQLRRHDKPPLTVELRLDSTYEGDGLIAFFDTLYKMERELGFRKHHALDDARALRAAVMAAENTVRAKGAI